MPIFNPIKNITQQFLQVLLPPSCISCSEIVEIQGQLCGECWGNISFIGKHKCNCCGVPFEFDMGKGALCGHCQAKKPNFRRVRAACSYEGVGKKLAAKLKFHDKTLLATSMARMMFNSGGEVLRNVDIIMPVPLHKWRKFWRKYNQSELLAVALMQHVERQNVACETNLLKRVRATKQQTKLSYGERQKNVRSAFVVTAPEQIEGKRILLIDDVLTTGATMNECARALKKAGAKQVNGLVFARVKPN